MSLDNRRTVYQVVVTAVVDMNGANPLTINRMFQEGVNGVFNRGGFTGDTPAEIHRFHVGVNSLVTMDPDDLKDPFVQQAVQGGILRASPELRWDDEEVNGADLVDALNRVMEATGFQQIEGCAKHHCDNCARPMEKVVRCEHCGHIHYGRSEED